MGEDEDGLNENDDVVSGLNLLQYAPRCPADFSERWVRLVLDQYYMTQLGLRGERARNIKQISHRHKFILKDIGPYKVEMAGAATKPDPTGTATADTSRHFLSEAYR